MKLIIGLKNFKGVFASVWFNIATSDRLSFESVEIDKNVSLHHPGGKVCVTGGHVTSRNQGLSPNDKGRQRRESLGTRLACFIREQRTADATFHENSAECVGKLSFSLSQNLGRNLGGGRALKR